MHKIKSVLLIAAVLLPSLAWGQGYPTKPIRIVVPFPAGGSIDVIARIVGRKLSASLGQNVIIDNRSGATGNIGTELVARSPADGYTLLAISSSFVINPSLYAKVGYDPIADFEPVSTLTTYMLFLVAHPSLPARSVKALITLAKAQPGRINYASVGTGTTTHMTGELFSYMAGIRMTHIPYRGTVTALTEVIGGQVPLHFGSYSAVPHVKAKKLIMLGVTGTKRSPAFPDIPTIGESAVPGFEVTSWNALFAPAGTPAAIVKRLSEEIGKGLSQADAAEVFEQQGLDQAAGTPEALAAVIKAEVAKWARVIKASGIQQQ